MRNGVIVNERNKLILEERQPLRAFAPVAIGFQLPPRRRVRLLHDVFQKIEGTRAHHALAR